MLLGMRLLFDSFWRALGYCLHPRVLSLSLLPLLIMAALAWIVSHFYWDAAVQSVAEWITASGLLRQVWDWLGQLGGGNFATVLAPLLVLAAAVPVIVILCLLGVAAFMTPALVALVARSRFSALQKRQGASFWQSLWWSLGSSLMGLLAIAVSSPLWLIPPLILIVPPLIWGWLAYRVMAFDALAEHASRQERQVLLRRHRMPLLIIGLLTGYLGAAPAIVWASGVFFAAAFFVLIPLGIWIYTMVFALSSLWFAHYCLAALGQLREAEGLMLLPPTRDHLGAHASASELASRTPKKMRKARKRKKGNI